MPFNKSAFMKAQYEPRTAIIDVTPLADFFSEGEKPEWIVRGQTANEVSKSLEASRSKANLSGVVAAISENQQQIDEIRLAVGLSDETTEDIIKRLEQLVTCSVEPVIDLPCAVKVAEAHPIEFYLLTNKIVALTGLGMDRKKPKPSGEAKK